MRKVALISVVVLSALMLMPLHASSSETGVTIEKAEVSISGHEVNEKIYFSSTVEYNGTLQLWMPSENYKVECMGKELSGTLDGYALSINLGEQGITVPAGGAISLNVTYTLKNRFEYRALYPAGPTNITVKSEEYPRGNIPIIYEGNNIYSSNVASMEKDSSIWIEFVEESSTGTNLSSVLMGSFAVLVAIIIIFLIVKRRRGESSLGKESSEALELRKRLLTDALKTLEMEHDKKKIPDTYYRSIKDYFKKEAIKVLRELDRRT